MLQVIEQTHEEKMKMYMKCTKKKLAEMLIESNRILDEQLQLKNSSYNLLVSGDTSSSTTTMKEGYYSDNFNMYYIDKDGKIHSR